MHCTGYRLYLKTEIDICCYYVFVETHQRPHHPPSSNSFSLSLLINFLNLLLHFSNTSPSPLHLHLPTTNYLNCTLSLSFYLPLFFALFLSSYFKFSILSYFMHSFPTHKKLYLSLSFSQNVFFFFFKTFHESLLYVNEFLYSLEL